MSADFEPAYCAYVDVLGFRRKIEEAHNERKEEQFFASLTKTFSECAAHMKEAQQNLALFKVKFFSDNMVAAIQAGAGGITHFTILCQFLAEYQLALACKEGLFLRGGLAFGPVGINEDLIFGKCLLDAHDVERKLANVPRIIIHPDLQAQIAKQFPSLEPSWQSTLKLRLVCDADGHFFVNYLQAAYQPRGLIRYINEEIVSMHRDQVERLLQQARREQEIWFKYFWVANYHNHFCEVNGQQGFKIAEDLLLPKPTDLA